MNENTRGDIDQLYNRYFDEYYYESDIDIAICEYNIVNFMKTTRLIYNHLANKIAFHFGCSISKIKYTVLRSTYLFVSSEFIKNHIINEKYSYEYILN